MTVTVAMPYYGCGELVQRAARSVLAQTHRDLRLVIIGDGQVPPLGDLRDDRLVVYTLPENRGAYFAFQLILQASPDEWHAPHGADDWTNPTHIESLLALGESAVAVSTCWHHEARLDPVPPATLSGGGKRGWHVGIFDAERLRGIGGYDPSTRLSQDTHVLRLLDLTGGYYRHYSEQPTYHRWKWGGSLTTAPATNLQSPARLAARAYNAPILARCRRLKTPERIKAFRESLIPKPIAAELAEHVERLREQL